MKCAKEVRWWSCWSRIRREQLWNSYERRWLSREASNEDPAKVVTPDGWIWSFRRWGLVRGESLWWSPKEDGGSLVHGGWGFTGGGWWGRGFLSARLFEGRRRLRHRWEEGGCFGFLTEVWTRWMEVMVEGGRMVWFNRRCWWTVKDLLVQRRWRAWREVSLWEKFKRFFWGDSEGEITWEFLWWVW